jgi:Lysine-specific metallo-endopeptidase
MKVVASLNPTAQAASAFAADTFAGLTASTASTRPTRFSLAPRTRLAQNGTNGYSSRSLTPSEKTIVRSSLEQAKVLLERTRLSLTVNWNKPLPNSNIKNSQVFKQYFDGTGNDLRVEVLARLDGVLAKVKTMLSQDVGKTVAVGTGTNASNYGYVFPNSGNQTVYLGTAFVKTASSDPTTYDSKAGTFVHELFHLVEYNGKKGTDDIAGYSHTDKRIYNESTVRALAEGNSKLAVANNNLFEWYVEREK